MPNVASPTDQGSRPPAARALQHDGRALLRLATDAAADIAHIGLVLFLVACSLVRKVCTAPHGHGALTCATHPPARTALVRKVRYGLGTYCAAHSAPRARALLAPQVQPTNVALIAVGLLVTWPPEPSP